MNPTLQILKVVTIRFAVLILALVLIPSLINFTKAQSNCFPAPQEIITNSNGEASNYNLVYQLSIPQGNTNWNQQSDIPYSVNNAASLSSASFTRVAYYMKLHSPFYGDQWVWVSMNAFTNNINLIGIPTGNTIWQQQVNNMTIYANSVGTGGTNSGSNIATGTGITGNIEFWSHAYTQPNSGGVPGASDASFDFGDAPDPNLPDFYGSFQIHNFGAQQTVLAYNGWSDDGADSPEDLGIGTQLFGETDWTFARTSVFYDIKELYVFVNNSCGNNTSVSVTVSAPAIPCSNGTTTLTAQVTGGNGSETYSLNGGAPQSGNTFIVGPGTYTVTVQSGASSATSNTVVIANPTPVTVSAAAPPIGCNSGATTLTATAGGGAGSFSYSLNGGTAQPGNTFTVGSGSYTVTVTDGNGCPATSNTVVVGNSSGILVTASAPPVSCFNGTSTLTANASGGSGSLSYSLNGGAPQSGNTFIVGPGSNTVTVTDGNGCSGTSNAVVLANPAPVSVSINATEINCNNGPTTITASAAGGTGPYTYKLNNTGGQSSNIFNAPAGTYSVTVVDSKGCTATSNTLTIGNPEPINASAAATTILCNGGATTITVTAAGGTGNLSYKLDGGSPQAGNTFATNGGSHSIVVTDSKGCTKTISLNVAQPTALGVSAVAGTIGCNQNSTTLTASSTGGTGAKTFKLDNGAFQASNTFTVSAGTHTVTVKDANGCMATTSLQIAPGGNGNGILAVTIPDVFAFNPGANANTIYLGYGPASLTLTANPAGGSGTYTYLWTTGATTKSITVNPSQPGLYLYLVTVKDGCKTGIAFKLVQVVDVTCSKNKVEVCHKASKTKKDALCIAPSAVSAHLAHGDQLGSCSLWNNDQDDKSMARPGTNTEQMSIAPDANVYPNPTRGKFDLQVSAVKAGKAQVEIVNANGAVIERRAVQLGGKGQVLSFDLGKQPAGIYMVRLVSLEGVQTYKVIVQK